MASSAECRAVCCTVQGSMIDNAGQCVGHCRASVGVCCYNRVSKEASTKVVISSLKVLYSSFKVLYCCSLVVLH